MDTSTHDLASFFSQLGLPNTSQDINNFVASHQLAAGTGLAKATFWTDAQAAFIKQALIQDSDWAAVADELAVKLTKPDPH